MSDGIGISTADLPAGEYVSNHAQRVAAVDAARVQVERAQAHLNAANDALAVAEAELAATPEE